MVVYDHYNGTAASFRSCNPGILELNVPIVAPALRPASLTQSGHQLRTQCSHFCPVFRSAHPAGATGHTHPILLLSLACGQPSFDLWHSVLSHSTKQLDHLCIGKSKSALRSGPEIPHWKMRRLTIYEPRATSRCIYGCLAVGFKHVEHLLGTANGTWNFCACLRHSLCR